MITISYIKHSEIETEVLEDIITLKNQYWKYSKEQHLDWISKNLSSEDFHIIVRNDNEELLAYLNLVLIEIRDNQSFFSAYGIGNVCVSASEAGIGLGGLVMQASKYFLNKKKIKGFLLCKEELVPFYKSAGWKRFEGDFSVGDNKIGGVLMSLGSYESQSLKIDKNF